MRATFCPTCGETRWQLAGLPVQRAKTCGSCGTELRTERRLPGRRRQEPPAERRHETGEHSVTPPPTA